ncbi:MAG: hypothetical protein KDA93_11435 [Planctomycetaceae bacterium]|nr:hypothetical protein [Planctomycetaceae bacterium]
MIASLVVEDRSWLAPCALMLVAATVLLTIAYRHISDGLRTRLWAYLPKLIAFALLAACLIDPLWSHTRAKPGENLFVLLADNSASLTINSSPDIHRGKVLTAALSDAESRWQVRLAQDFDVRRYTFDSRLANVTDFSGIQFDGTSSSIETVLATLGDRYEGQPLAGVLMFTDGNSTDVMRDTYDVESLPPIYPVLPPVSELPPDLSVTKVAVSETVFEDSPVTIQIEVTATGIVGEDVIVELVDEAGTVVEEQRLPIADSEPLSVQFETLPTKPGLTFYTVQVTRADESTDAESSEPTTAEATLDNNSRIVAVNREGRPYRVLYVGGRPNWEYRFLNRALKADPQVELVSLIRIAKKEAKFDFRGRDDESSNPLFRGFAKEGDEETESYDEAVLIRLVTKDEVEVRDGFPKTKEQLYAYDALILDDVEAAFFTHDQLSLLERFVSERGGGLMMLGGIDTFQHGEYAQTPVADVLPVYLDRRVRVPPDDAYRLSLSRDGWLQPWMRLRRNEADEQMRLAEMPEFTTVTRVESVKPGARVMATFESTRGDALPAVVAQRYGAGRSLAMLAGDLWRWSLRREAGAKDDLAQTWRQSIRWLVSDLPQRLSAQIERADANTQDNQSIPLSIRVRSAEFEAEDNADLRVTVTQPDGEQIELVPRPSVEEAGLFQSAFAPRLPGAYRATVELTDPKGTKPLMTTIGWTSNPAADEFRHIDVDRKRMQNLAEATGGEVVAPDDLESFVTTLPTRHAIVTETLTTPLWHRSWMFALVLVCLAAEWGVRRLRGLP